ncbi:MAG: 4-hydroxy-3-methylbut-2-enyl diphosphate reductase, partial [Planctomycetota bacterium]
NSSNSSRLRDLGERAGVPSYLVDDPADVTPDWVAGRPRIGVTAGASAPDDLVHEILERLKELGVTDVREVDGEPENVVFAMPDGL